jgi:hypothetical protein
VIDSTRTHRKLPPRRVWPHPHTLRVFSAIEAQTASPAHATLLIDNAAAGGSCNVDGLVRTSGGSESCGSRLLASRERRETTPAFAHQQSSPAPGSDERSAYDCDRPLEALEALEAPEAALRGTAGQRGGRRRVVAVNVRD